MPDGTTPLVTFVGVTLKATPLHVIVVIAVMYAAGLTVTVTLNTAPVHPPAPGDDGVTR